MKRIDSIQNPSIKAWKKLLTKKGRENAKKYIIEGLHLVEEAIKNDAPILHLLICEEIDIPATFTTGSYEVTYISKEVSKALSETETTQGVFAIVEFDFMRVDIKSIKKVILLDEIQDPGNAGTIIRTADAAGFDAVILGKGCCDLYNGKTIRSTQGSLFHIPIIRGDLHEWITNLKQENIKVFGTALEGAKPYKESSKVERFAILLGNEGNGVNKELLAITDENVYIPIVGKAESLNVGVAAGVLMYGLS
ncbi:RNA methyltransferase [Bacillus sp. RG28]|uniref:RNA methyltransferase n=1 Tax=Gottfriedia endophytica TaxID=2820819 RepID=A0A940SHJ3_9BACI|nr:RNA methyltransferase [Gottfriedia endophytica]MBP0724010.1 RNA methyltransferase [Gottfriedia endophytica]